MRGAAHLGAAAGPARAAALDAAAQMAWDEALLEGAPPGVLVLRVYEWAGPACTFGYSRPWEQARAACDARGWRAAEPVRRATGGGVVFHDGDLTFSLVFPWERLLSPGLVYKDIHRGVHSALKSLGRETALWSPPLPPGGEAALCFSRPEPMDLVARDGRKLLGGALRRRGGRGLYQGSLRAEGLGLGREELSAALARAAAAEFGRAPQAPRPEWAPRTGERELRYRSPEWNRRR